MGAVGRPVGEHSSHPPPDMSSADGGGAMYGSRHGADGGGAIYGSRHGAGHHADEKAWVERSISRSASTPGGRAGARCEFTPGVTPGGRAGGSRPRTCSRDAEEGNVEGAGLVRHGAKGGLVEGARMQGSRGVMVGSSLQEDVIRLQADVVRLQGQNGELLQQNGEILQLLRQAVGSGSGSGSGQPIASDERRERGMGFLHA